MVVSFTVSGVPMGKPRMTQRDRWAKRSCVLRYWEWAAVCRGSMAEACLRVGLDLDFAMDSMNVESLSWTARFEPAKSWSKKRRAECLGVTHRMRPDRDNIDKAVCDALFKEDSGIGPGYLDKVWAEEPGLDLVIVYLGREIE